MSSAKKAFELLWLFSTQHPEIGLSQLCRMAKRDKATTYRHLQALEGAGFVEQNPATKNYRLGPAVVQLARMRESTVPREAGAQAALTVLAQETGETAHISVLSGETLFPLLSCESPAHSTRAIIDLTTFPLHATASGLCALAFGPEALYPVALTNMQSYTDQTPTTPESLAHLVNEARETGFGRSDQCLEDNVHSLSAPVFDQTGQFAGSISVAAVASRFTPDLEATIKDKLITASRNISRNWGGAIPPDIENAWASPEPSSQTEPAP